MSTLNQFSYSDIPATTKPKDGNQDILEKILAELQSATGREKGLWKIQDIANYCSCSLAPAYIIVKNRNFPRPIRLPTSSNGSGGKRWVAKEVIAYLKGCK